MLYNENAAPGIPHEVVNAKRMDRFTLSALLPPPKNYLAAVVDSI